MRNCGNKSPHDEHLYNTPQGRTIACPGAKRNPTPENVVMNTYHALMLFTSLILIRRWTQKHKN